MFQRPKWFERVPREDDRDIVWAALSGDRGTKSVADRPPIHDKPVTLRLVSRTVSPKPSASVDGTEELHASIPGSHLERIAGASHLANLDKPNEFNRAIDDYLSAVDASV